MFRIAQSLSGLAVLSALIGSGGLLFISGLIGGLDYYGFLIAGAIWVGIGLLGLGSIELPKNRPIRSVIAAALAGLATLLVTAFIPLAAVDIFEGLDGTLLEAVSGITAANLSVLENVELLDNSILFWRASIQWMGGFGALCFLAILLPLFVESRELGEADKRFSSTQVIMPSIKKTFRQIAEVYLAGTLILAVAYRIAGMGVFDAVTHSFTTISTGGFSNYSDGLAHFNSSAVQWVAVFGMFAAGIRPTLLWWALRRTPTAFWRSIELKVYFLVLAAVSLIVILVENGGIRESLFSTTSAVSGTGFFLQDWGGWHSGLQALMLFAIATGAMAGTAGGGFRMRRAIEAVRYVYRELVIQLHPKAIYKVKMGSQVIGEANLSQMQTFQHFFLLAAFLGAFGLAQFGADLTSAIGGAFSALSTMGPSIGELFSTPEALAELPRPARGVLIVMMLIGRLAIYPLLLMAWYGMERLSRGIRIKRG